MTEADIVVVGGGIAGLAAAREVAGLGRRCVTFTGPQPGGHLLSINAVQDMPDHPDGVPGYDLCPMMLGDAMDAGVDCLTEDALGLEADGDAWIVRGSSSQVRAAGVILAPGSRLKRLDVPGEADFEGRGVSQCASCDGPMLRAKPVAVVGGGDAACQEALTLAESASEVHMLVRGSALRARPAWRARIAAEPKIRLRFGVRVAAIAGDGAVREVRLADGSALAVDAVFIFVGLDPNTGFVRDLVPLDAAGRMIVDAGLHTPRRGVFGAGDARSGSSGQAAEALADGRAAARSAQRFLGQRDWPAF
ncbi:MAG: FAD-dependent oxidoreductase [Burkholderiales bacterium]|nr:FAD-dependent oxidoreductase [Burkholderiales bacterium]